MGLQRLDTAIHPRERQKRFLAAFAACGSILRASRWAGVHRQAHYWWMHEDSTYRVRFQEAQRQAAGMLEDEAVRRAHEGVKRPVLYKGKPVLIQGEPLYEVTYSDTILMRLLEAYDPERFKPRVEQWAPWDGDLNKLTPAQAKVVADQLVQQLTGGDPVKIEALRRKALQPAAQQIVDVKPDARFS